MKTDTTKTPASTVLVPVLRKHKLMRHGRNMSDPYSWEWNITYSAELEEDLHKIGWPMHSATTKLYFAVFDLDPEVALELSRAELGELRASVALDSHTPGPWSVFHSTLGIRPGIEASSHSVIIYGTERDDSGIKGASDAEILANAQLIAAAPDLYLAAKEALRILSQLVAGPTAKAMLRKALAKAEGKEEA